MIILYSDQNADKKQVLDSLATKTPDIAHHCQIFEPHNCSTYRRAVYHHQQLVVSSQFRIIHLFNRGIMHHIDMYNFRIDKSLNIVQIELLIDTLFFVIEIERKFLVKTKLQIRIHRKTIITQSYAVQIKNVLFKFVFVNKALYYN